MNTQQLQDMNADIETVKIKGKNYAMVFERIKALRKVIPNASIETEVVHIEDGSIIIRATVRDDDGHIIGTGHAEEKDGNGNINMTSFVENCETSAVGRALGMCGIGIDDSFASADEMATAIKQTKNISKKEKDYLKSIVESKNYTVAEIFPLGLDLTAEQYAEACRKLTRLKARSKEDLILYAEKLGMFFDPTYTAEMIISQLNDSYSKHDEMFDKLKEGNPFS